MNPQLSNAELEKHYSNKEYYSLKGIDTKSKKFKLKIFLYNLYFNSEIRKPIQRVLFSPIKYWVRGTRIRKGERILDNGSGTGQFLYELGKLGLDTYGLEPGAFEDKGIESKNLKIKKGFLKQGLFEKKFFDLITLNHVLEHVNNPKEVLTEINRLLKGDGLFIVGVPNTHSLARKIFKKTRLAYDLPRHLINYSDKNLINFLKKNGFKIVKVRYNSRPSQFSVSLRYLLGFNKKFEKILDIIFLPLTWIVNAMKVGDQIEVWCEKR
ncbi:MAG TPA: class I SAM-dependent methyltransferase [Nanoarchaeota archaeon]|nr:class I SAM-dependent methyltransferase [Nanoarchaeota archaeon]